MDTSVCFGSLVSLNAIAVPDAVQAGFPIDYSMSWSNGDVGESISVDQEGDYTVTISYQCGNTSDIS